MLCHFPRLLALSALALFPLSALATPTLEPRAANAQTQKVLRDGFTKARISIKSTDLSQRPDLPIFMLFSYGQTSDEATFFLVAVPPDENTPEYEVLEGSVNTYRPFKNPQTGLVQVQLYEVGSVEVLEMVPLNGLKAEGWVWYNKVFTDLIYAIELKPDGRQPVGKQVYSAVMSQLRVQKTWVPLK